MQPRARVVRRGRTCTMRTAKLHEAQQKVLALLADDAPHEPLELIAVLGSDFDRATSRAAILDLIENARVRWTSQRCLQRVAENTGALQP